MLDQRSKVNNSISDSSVICYLVTIEIGSLGHSFSSCHKSISLACKDIVKQTQVRNLYDNAAKTAISASGRISGYCTTIHLTIMVAKWKYCHSGKRVSVCACVFCFCGAF